MKATSILRVLPLEVLRVAVTPVGCPGTTAAGHGRVSNERKNERGGTGAHRGRRGRRAPRGTPRAGALHPRSYGAHLFRAARCGFGQSCSGKPGAVVCRQAVAPRPALAVVRASELSSERPRPRGGSPRLRAPAALARAALVRPPPPRQALGLSFAPGPALPASEPARDQPRNQRQLPHGEPARGPRPGRRQSRRRLGRPLQNPRRGAVGGGRFARGRR